MRKCFFCRFSACHGIVLAKDKLASIHTIIIITFVHVHSEFSIFVVCFWVINLLIDATLASASVANEEK